mgnify:FL=1
MDAVRPITVTDDNTHLDSVKSDFVGKVEHKDDHVIDNDVFLGSDDFAE